MREWIEAERVRERLAHQLHDGPIQELTAAQLFFDGLSLRMDALGVEPELRDGVERGLGALRQATLACRELMERLRPGIGVEGELEERLDRLVHGRWPEAFVETAVRSAAGGTPGATTALIAFRVAEELLEHARRAGTGPREVRLEEAEGGAFVLTFELDPAAPAVADLPESWSRAGVAVTADGPVWRAIIPAPRPDPGGA